MDSGRIGPDGRYLYRIEELKAAPELIESYDEIFTGQRMHIICTSRKIGIHQEDATSEQSEHHLV